jgi:filamentous hemagglutinin family protein
MVTCKKRLQLMLAFAAPFSCTGLALCGTVITDGSLGAARTLSGPTYSIPSSLGQIHKGNLFQSLSTLNLSPGDVAVFSGPSTVANVLVRVTGGLASSIDGTIQCTMPHAAFYLINPSGVVFGPSAALDVQGSFAVTTADEVKLSDGHVFGRPGAGDATLSSAPPAAFGFLSARPAALTVNGAFLRVPTAKAMTLAAGAIQITNGAVVRAPRGNISVLSVGSSATATLSAGHAPAASAGALLGDVAIQQNSSLTTTSSGGGRIEVNADNLTLTDSAIDARTLGAINGGGIGLQLTGTLQNSDSSIFTNTSGSGAAGNIAVNAASFIADNGVSGMLTGMDSRSLAAATGAAGNITVHAQNLSLADGQEITATTASSAPGGVISVVADRIAISGFADNAGAAPSGLLDNSTASGAGGAIRVHANTLRVESGGVILCGTVGGGSGGKISITADDLTVHGNDGDNPTGITTATEATSLAGNGVLSVHAGDVHLLGGGEINSQTLGAGSAGQVTLRASTLSLSDGGELTSQTFAAGGSGDVALDVTNLHLDGADAAQATEISASAGTDSSGPAGNVTVLAKLATIANGADITTSTFGTGAAGRVSVAAKTIQINGRNAGDNFTGIDSDAQEDSTGNAGSVQVLADSLSIVAGGEIASDTDGTGRAGGVGVVANQIKIDGRGSLTTAEISSDSRGTDTGAAGSVRVHGDSIRLDYGGEIESATYGAANGGEVSLTAHSLVVDGADTQGFTAVDALALGGSTGRSGDVSIQADQIELDSSGAITTDTLGSGAGGNITLTADDLIIDGINSAAATGVSAAAFFGSTGSAGNIAINANSVRLVHDGSITSDTAGPGAAGMVKLHAGQLVADGTGGTGFTHISSNADAGSSGNGGPVQVEANQISLAAGGEISSTTSGAGHGGDVTVIADEFKMAGEGSTYFTGVAADTLAAQTGDAGSIRIHAASIRMSQEARIDDDSNGSGNGGNISITASQFLSDGGNSARVTGVTAVAQPNSTGNSGSIAVRSQDLSLLAGSQISAETLGTGRGGDVSVTGGRVIADGRGSAVATQINASTIAPNSGAAGNIQVAAHDVHLIAASINSENDGAAAGGNVSVKASHFIANSQGSPDPSGISAQANAGSSGDAGSVRVHFDQAELVDGGQITSSTGGSGNGGDIRLDARSLRIDGANINQATGVLSNAVLGTGNAGSIRAQIGSAIITSGGEISSSTFTSGDGGDVNVTAHDMLIDGRDGTFATGLAAASEGSATGAAGDIQAIAHGYLTLRGNGSIAALALHANGGNISVTANHLNLEQGAITSSAAGAGGDIAIGPGSSLIIAPGGHIAAASAGTERSDNGGNVTIGRTALTFLPGVGKDAITASANQGNGGNIQIDSSVFLRPPGTPANAIDSSSLGGIAGTITIDTPDVDLAGELVPLVSSLAAPGIALVPNCGMQVGPDQSSFTLEGGNGLPLDPANLRPAGATPTTQP